MFTTKEIAYLRGQRLGRLATVAVDGQPDNVAVGFRLEDDGVILVGGRQNKTTRKYKHVAAGQAKVALIVDDLESVDPWRPRGIRIYGTAAVAHRDGPLGPADYIVITPTLSWSWNVEAPAFVDGRFRPHRTEH